MRFNTEADAYEWWEEAYHVSGGGQPGFDTKLTLFKDWVDDRGVTWLEDEILEIIKELSIENI